MPSFVRDCDEEALARTRVLRKTPGKIARHCRHPTTRKGRTGKLIYAINTSLDGFSQDATGSFDWSVPDEDVHQYYNDMMRSVGTQLLGRRMYETMAVCRAHLLGWTIR